MSEPAGHDITRQRRLWLATGVLLTVTVAVLVAALSWIHVITLGPRSGLLVTLLFLPLAVLAGHWEPTSPRGSAALQNAVTVAGVSLSVVGVYLMVVVGFGHVPTVAEGAVLGTSIVAAALAALVAWPVAVWLHKHARIWVIGRRGEPEAALAAFGGALSRSTPMDELLLSLAESLKTTLRLTRAEIWTGFDGNLTRSVSVPGQPDREMFLSGEASTVVVRARVQGMTWARVWLPDLAAGRRDAVIRVVSIAHLGELLGLFVLERPPGGEPFTDQDDQVVLTIARQLGLALHNVRLDSALQASLRELEIRNAELQSSRERIVTAADESRRRIERDLHDGAQQHLVALAVKVSLIKAQLATNPDTAALLVDEIRGDLRDTLVELRELAHGIYPPLLRERGLREALRAAASRSVVPTSVNVADLDRYPAVVEAAVYFCCIEALQNAAKHAGPQSQVTIDVTTTDQTLTFQVTDDGAGFDVNSTDPGQGITSMRDRVGVFGGSLAVTSSPGAGTQVTGSIPVPEVPPPRW
jgi:signal transduction histidine kinase